MKFADMPLGYRLRYWIWHYAWRAWNTLTIHIPNNLRRKLRLMKRRWYRLTRPLPARIKVGYRHPARSITGFQGNVGELDAYLKQCVDACPTTHPCVIGCLFWNRFEHEDDCMIWADISEYPVIYKRVPQPAKVTAP